MRHFRMYGAAVALTLALWPGMASAVANPKPIEMIWGSDHFANVEKGAELVYHFKRDASDPKTLAELFTDDVTLKIVDVTPTGSKDVDVQIYSGDRARDPIKFTGRTFNPIFNIYFTQTLSRMALLAGGLPTYFKRALDEAFKDKATLEPVNVSYRGKMIDAYRITITPYVDDPRVGKMKGWENTQNVIVYSDKVPGEVVEMVATYQRGSGSNLRLEERYTLDGVEGIK